MHDNVKDCAEVREKVLCSSSSIRLSAVCPAPNTGLWDMTQISIAGGRDQGMATDVKAGGSDPWCGMSWLMGNSRSGIQGIVEIDGVIVEGSCIMADRTQHAGWKLDGSYFMLDGIVMRRHR